MIKKFDVVASTQYEDKKTGELKYKNRNIGEITEFTKEDGSISRILELSMFPGVRYTIFEQKPREERQGGFNQGFNQGYKKPAKKQSEVETIGGEEELPIVHADDEEEEIDSSDIPF